MYIIWLLKHKLFIVRFKINGIEVNKESGCCEYKMKD